MSEQTRLYHGCIGDIDGSEDFYLKTDPSLVGSLELLLLELRKYVHRNSAIESSNILSYLKELVDDIKYEKDYHITLSKCFGDKRPVIKDTNPDTNAGISLNFTDLGIVSDDILEVLRKYTPHEIIDLL